MDVLGVGVGADIHAFELFLAALAVGVLEVAAAFGLS